MIQLGSLVSLELLKRKIEQHKIYKQFQTTFSLFYLHRSVFF